MTTQSYGPPVIPGASTAEQAAANLAWQSNQSTGAAVPGPTPTQTPDWQPIGPVAGSDVNKPGAVSAYTPVVTGSDTVRSNVNDVSQGLDTTGATAVTGNGPSLTDLNTLAGNINAQTAAEQAQIEQAGQQAGAQYDRLIAETQKQEQMGMAKATIGAGEMGGFMSTQFAGVAALQPIQGGTFEGIGGQLSQARSEFTMAINDLQTKKIAAIQQAKDAMALFIKTGKQDAFNNAEKLYQDAQQAAKDQADAAYKQAQTILDIQKASFDINAPVGSSSNPKVQDWILTQTTKYPGIIDAAGGPVQFSKLSATQIGQLIQNDPTFKQEQLKASFGTGGYGDYQQAKASGDFTGTYQQWLAANKASTTIVVGGGGGSGGSAVGTVGSATINKNVPGYSTKIITGGLTQAAIDAAALQFALTGTMPSIGLGSTGAAGEKRTAIENRAAELDAGGNIQANKAKLTSYSKSLTQQVEFVNSTQRALASADTNFQQVIDSFKGSKINPSDSTAANKSLAWIRTHITGGDQFAFDAGIQEVKNDYAIVFSRGGSVTDQARKAADQAINDKISWKDLQKVHAQLTSLGQTIVDTGNKQIDQINGQINTIISGGTDLKSTGTSTVLTGPDGKKYTVPNDQVASFIAAGGHY